ncbi:hypothetical protein [Bacillus infantis]|nr:hypothetical protein [Bacillus infantis]
MTVEELIKQLQKVNDKSKLIYVWNGYNAATMTTNFEVLEEDDGTVTIN